MAFEFFVKVAKEDKIGPGANGCSRSTNISSETDRHGEHCTKIFSPPTRKLFHTAFIRIIDVKIKVQIMIDSDI